MRTSTLIRTSGALALLLAFSPMASAASFSDVAGSRNSTAIQFLSARGVIAGYADGTFRPGNSINRAELAKILVTGNGQNPGVDQYNGCFSDVASEWFAPYVCYAKAQGWVVGYSDGTFRPSNPVNTAEALKMILNAQGVAVSSSSLDNTYTDVDGNAWYAPYVETAHAKNLLQAASGKLGIERNMTRGLVAESIYRSLSMKMAGTSRFGSDPSVPPDQPGAASSSSSSLPPVVIDTKRKYKDGTYSATGNYFSPSGQEEVQVSLTLSKDVIVDASYQGTAQFGRSQMYQQFFGDGYRELVVGKPIDQVSLTVVNGASLTPQGFMDALAQIKSQASAS